MATTAEALAIPTAYIGTSTPTWTPADITTEAWYDASDASTITSASGLVSQWDDKSGNDFHVSQPTGSLQPQTGVTTLAGKNTICFDGNDDYIFRASGFTNKIYSLFAVVVNYDVIDETSGATLFISTYNDNYSSGSGLGATTSALTNEVVSILDEDNAGQFNDRQGISNSNVSSITAGGHKYSFVLDQGLTNWFMGFDGSVDLRDLSAGLRHPLYFDSSYSMGAGTRQPGIPEAFLNGCIAEVIALSTTATESLRLQIESYFSRKWGV